MKQMIIAILLIAYSGLFSQVTISEILFEPPTWDTDLQYIEILNYGDSTINLANWSINGSVNLGMIPIELLPGEKYVMCSDLLALLQHGIVMERAGQWAPGVQINSAPLFLIRDSSGQEVVRIDYGSDSNWPIPESGVSIELCDPQLDNNNGLNWAISENSILSNDNNGNELIGTPSEENTCTEIGTSSSKTDKYHQINLFPNPCHSILKIGLEVKVETLIIYSTSGTQLLEVKNENNIDVSSLSNGVYHILIESNGIYNYERFVKL